MKTMISMYDSAKWFTASHKPVAISGLRFYVKTFANWNILITLLPNAENIVDKNVLDQSWIRSYWLDELALPELKTVVNLECFVAWNRKASKMITKKWCLSIVEIKMWILKNFFEFDASQVEIGLETDAKKNYVHQYRNRCQITFIRMML